MAKKVRKFAKIVTASLLCRLISLALTINAGYFVEVNEKYGRNRPIEYA
jgi:hypothetical protein